MHAKNGGQGVAVRVPLFGLLFVWVRRGDAVHLAQPPCHPWHVRRWSIRHAIKRGCRLCSELVNSECLVRDWHHGSIPPSARVAKALGGNRISQFTSCFSPLFFQSA